MSETGSRIEEMTLVHHAPKPQASGCVWRKVCNVNLVMIPCQDDSERVDEYWNIETRNFIMTGKLVLWANALRGIHESTFFFHKTVLISAPIQNQFKKHVKNSHYLVTLGDLSSRLRLTGNGNESNRKRWRSRFVDVDIFGTELSKPQSTVGATWRTRAWAICRRRGIVLLIK
jgi:hypothetical protein